jgi:sortase (surface protein transpeptidase)
MIKIPSTLLIIALFICVFAAGSRANAMNTSFTQDLTIGMSGSEVSALQQILITGGFLNISVPTGYFGTQTKTALGAWQVSMNISPSAGYFGLLSRGKINETAPLATATTITKKNTVIAATERGLPLRLTIPKIAVDAGFQYNGLASDGTMEIPTTITEVGWFTGSVRPGEKGVALVTGHVAQIRKGVVTKQGVFYNLNELRPGDTLSVLDNKGKTITFVVRESRLYDPSADATDVFTAKDNGAHLNIITCEGTWNPDALSYSKRLVLFTDLVQ